MSQGATVRRPMLTISTFKSIEESSNLFNFDTFINDENFVVNSTSHIYRNKKQEYVRGKKVQVVTKQNAMNGELPDFNFQMLFSVNIKQQDQKISYAVGKPENLKDQQKLKAQWLQNSPFVCLNNHGRTNEVKSYPIVEGDIIKLGKSYLKVLQTHLSKGKVTQLPQVCRQMLPQLCQNNGQPDEVAKICKFCLMESDQHEEVISPCNCKGSCKFVHLSCLKIWFQNKVTTQNNRLVTSYHLSKFQCEICKTPLPNKINVKGKQQLFVEFRKPAEPYIVLGKIQLESQEKSLFVLTPREVGVKIGRGNTVELRINDQSMSRIHGLIEFKGGEFILSDLGSKFGSLVLVQDELKFERIMCLQMRNKIYKLEVIPSINPRAQVYLS